MLFATRTETPRRWRVGVWITAAGALVVLIGMSLPWFTVVRAVGPVTQTAWQEYQRTDLLLAALAIGGAAAAFLPRAGWSRAARLVCAGLGFVAIAHVIVKSSPRYGAWISLVGFALLALGALVDLPAAQRLTAPVGRRLAPVMGGLEPGVRRATAGAAPWARRLWRIVLAVVTSSWAIGIVLAAITWPIIALDTAAGTDSSWVTALQIGAHRGLSYPSDLLFTYGPLGFIDFPRLHYPGLVPWSFAYVAVGQVAFAISALWAARRNLGLVLGVFATLIALWSLVLATADEISTITIAGTVIIWAVAALRWQGPRGPLSVYGLSAAFGLLAGLEIMVKLNSGITVLLVLGIAVIAIAEGRRVIALPLFGASFIAGILLVCLITGERVGDLPRFFYGAYQIVSGFQEYQYTENGDILWQYIAAPFLASIVLFSAWNATRYWPWQRRVAGLVIAVIYVFGWWKQGFARHDNGHAVQYFAALPAAAIAFGWDNQTRLAAWAALGAMFIAVMGAHPVVPTGPRAAWAKFKDQLHQVRTADQQVKLQRANLVSREDVDGDTLALLRGHPTAIWPSEASIAWAYPQLDWKPLPVFQNYQAYTPWLDNLNEHALLAANGPKRILRSTETPGGYDSPRTTLALICNFREIHRTAKWEVLAKGGNRCGPKRPLGAVSTKTDLAVPIPQARPNELVVMRIDGYGLHFGERIRELLWRPYTRLVIFDPTSAGSLRVPPSLAGAPLLLNVPHRFDFPPPFRFSRDATSVKPEIWIDQTLQAAGTVIRPITVRFSAVPLNSPALNSPARG